MLLLAPLRRPARAALLLAGLSLYGFSDGLMLLADLGVDPWDVLQQGLSRTFGLQVGTWAVLVGAAVLLAWIPLRQRPGVGTVCNVVVIDLIINVTLALLPTPHALALRAVVLAARILLNATATGLYRGVSSNRAGSCAKPTRCLVRSRVRRGRAGVGAARR